MFNKRGFIALVHKAHIADMKHQCQDFENARDLIILKAREFESVLETYMRNIGNIRREIWGLFPAI